MVKCQGLTKTGSKCKHDAGKVRFFVGYMRVHLPLLKEEFLKK